jgi:hypothetical protein
MEKQQNCDFQDTNDEFHVAGRFYVSIFYSFNNALSNYTGRISGSVPSSLSHNVLCH